MLNVTVRGFRGQKRQPNDPISVFFRRIRKREGRIELNGLHHAFRILPAGRKRLVIIPRGVAAGQGGEEDQLLAEVFPLIRKMQFRPHDDGIQGRDFPEPLSSVRIALFPPKTKFPRE